MSGEETPRPRDFGDGPLSRASGAVYWLVLVTLLLALAAAPTVVVVLLLDRSAANLPFVVLAAVPLGPALSAALYATRARAGDEDLAPAKAFWRGYRLNVADVLKVWVPALVVLGISAYVLANADAAGLDATYVLGLFVIALIVLVWAFHAVVIASFFNFRARDVARLAAYFLFHKPKGSLAVVSLLVVAAGVAWFASPAWLAVLGGIWVWFWYRNALPMIDEVTQRFTLSGSDTA